MKRECQVKERIPKKERGREYTKEERGREYTKEERGREHTKEESGSAGQLCSCGCCSPGPDQVTWKVLLGMSKVMNNNPLLISVCV